MSPFIIGDCYMSLTDRWLSLSIDTLIQHAFLINVDAYMSILTFSDYYMYSIWNVCNIFFIN